MALEHFGVHMPKMHEGRCLPFLGSARSLVRVPRQFMAGLALRNGGIAGFRVMHRHMVFVADPDMVHGEAVS